MVVGVPVVEVVGHHRPSLRRGPYQPQAFVGHAGQQEALPVVEPHLTLLERVDNSTTHSAVARTMGGGELCPGGAVAHHGSYQEQCSEALTWRSLQERL